MKLKHFAAASVFAIGGVGMAVAPSASAAPIVTGGLVNVTVVDVLNHNEILKDVNVGVGAALGLAANVCGVGVNVLAVQLPGTATCTSNATGQRVTISQI